MFAGIACAGVDVACAVAVDACAVAVDGCAAAVVKCTGVVAAVGVVNAVLTVLGVCCMSRVPALGCNRCGCEANPGELAAAVATDATGGVAAHGTLPALCWVSPWVVSTVG